MGGRVLCSMAALVVGVQIAVCSGMHEQGVCIHEQGAPVGNVFGITDFGISDDPHMAIPGKRVCVTEKPALLVSYKNHIINLFNMSISKQQCVGVYSMFACPRVYPYAANVNCSDANLIAFGLMQLIPQCHNNSECTTRPPTVIPLISCKWAAEIKHRNCRMGPAHDACDSDDITSFQIQGDSACVMTESVCAWIVTNAVPIGTVASAFFFIMLSVVIVSCTTIVKNDIVK